MFLELRNHASLILQEKLYAIALLIVCASLPFNAISINSISVILLLVLWLLNGGIKKGAKELFNNRLLLLFTVFYFLHILFMLTTQNVKTGMFELEKKLSMLVLPWIILSSQPTNEKIKGLCLKVFCLSCLLMLLYSCYQIISYHLNGGKPFLAVDNTYEYREYFSQVAERHPTYTSMYITFASLTLFELAKRDQINKILAGTVLLFFVAIIFLLSSRLIIIGSIVFILLLSYLELRKKGMKKYFLWLSLVITSLSLLTIWHVPSIKGRLVTEFYDQYTFGPARGIHFNSLNTRVSETICGLYVISQHPILGVGTGDVQDHLNACYEKMDYSPALYENSYNPHNQYIYTWAGLGIVGIVVLILLLALLWKKVKFTSEAEYSYLVYIVTLLFFTETFLGFQKGIVFFSLFSTLLYVKKM